MFVFAVAFISHLLSDAVPHWDYPLASLIKKGDAKEWRQTPASLKTDLLRTGFDALAGVALVFLIIRPKTRQEFFWASAAALGGILPDFLQGVYYIGGEPRWLAPLQNFHQKIHSKIALGPYPLIGIPFQILIAGTALWILL
ncbi:MAG: hypothetical protein HY472_00850 [Candidatus Sungbacteria bacterium]|nr:hypothetical protein [Candidatus Sungbacteria bacterium]